MGWTTAIRIRHKTWVALVDGNKTQIRILRQLARKRRLSLQIVVDFIHVAAYVWQAGLALYPADSHALDSWVRVHLLEILRRKAGYVDAGMRRSATRRSLPAADRKPVDVCAVHLLRYATYLRYHLALSSGLPIATGVIEGVCRHLVNDRMNLTGARWSLVGAEAVFRLRALRSSDDLDDYWIFHELCEYQRKPPFAVRTQTRARDDTTETTHTAPESPHPQLVIYDSQRRGLRSGGHLFRVKGATVRLLACVLGQFGIAAAVETATRASGVERVVYIGTYTGETSKGIYAFRFNDSSGGLTPLGLVAETPSPSFLTSSTNGRFVFAVNELQTFAGAASGSVTSFTVDSATAKLTEISVQPSRGAGPCHLVLDRTGRYLAVANYGGGNFALFPVGADGRLQPATSVVAGDRSALSSSKPLGHAVGFDAGRGPADRNGRPRRR